MHQSNRNQSSHRTFHFAAIALLMLSLTFIACEQKDLWENLTKRSANVPAKTIQWDFVDGNPTLSTGLNRIPTYGAQDVHLHVFGNQLYAAWTERNANAGNPYQIRVAVYNGDRTWSLIDGNNIDGLNADPTKNAFTPWLGAYNGSLFITWSEMHTSETRIQVKRYDGSSIWTSVSGGTGINFSGAGSLFNAYSPQIANFGSNMMVTWYENNGTADQIRARYYDGVIWSWADLGGLSGINFNNGVNGQNPYATLFGSSLFVAWHENDGGIAQIRVQSYNGAWTWEDGGGGTGINISTARMATYVKLMVFNSKLYAIWEEGNIFAKQQIRFAVYTGGGIWTKLTNDTNCGVNRNWCH